MSRANRLIRLLHEIRLHTPPVTASRLSEALDVSERTIYRDIDALRQAGARIDGEAGFRIVYYPSGQCDGGTITLVDTRDSDDRLARILTIDPVSGEMTMERDE